MLKNFKKFFYEIKNRTMLIVVGCLFTFQVFYFNKENFLFFLAQPLLQGNNDPKINYFMFQNVSEIFSLYFDILFFATSQVFSFAFSFHAAAFALPASKPIEQARFKKFTRNTLSFWLLMVHITAAHLVPSTTFFFF